MQAQCTRGHRTACAVMVFVYVFALDGAGAAAKRIGSAAHPELLLLRMNVVEEKAVGAIWRPVFTCGPLTDERAAELEDRLRAHTGDALRTVRAFVHTGECIYRREGWTREEEAAMLTPGTSIHSQLLLL